MVTQVGNRELLKGLPLGDDLRGLAYEFATFIYKSGYEKSDIKALRKACRLTVKEVADASGLPQAQIKAGYAGSKEEEQYILSTIIIKAFLNSVKLGYFGTIKVAKN